ncbi:MULTISPECIES: pyridoxal phosphate-dependent aminotransferase [Enterococcaceae]|uniref:pyridoxal phosphate-dependent aminotransferase n=1 Tax=Enterococcaceae TaxID=81852 RepID=UPI000E530F9C|nr:MULTISPECIES: pyridoxal phosphate-dependent aminotransferase [Enterococcaceae]MCI0131291.1 pyridoxal phosphate-dependent aminotransferase [Vagococcus sp. CY53-2]RGI28685.1 pyridoxal phosphate-dependent aminotransferase [Melissococcus sp. OM08-11BH]
MGFSKKVKNLKESATLQAAAKAKALKDKGVDVLNLTIGEPDFSTPKSVQQAAIKSIEDGSSSFYTPATGLIELKKAIIERTRIDYGVEYQTNEVFIGNGAKYVLYALFQTLLNPGDEVIIPTPYWVSYSAQVELADGKNVFVETTEENHYRVTVEELERARTDKSRVLILNTPSNPTGTVYTAKELFEIGNWAVSNNIYIIADDIYAKLVYNGNVFTSIVSLSDAIKQQTIVVNGVSKTYSMTGWRIGYALCQPEIVSQVSKVMSQSTGNPATVSQYAAIEALSGSQDIVESMRQTFEQRLNDIFPLIQAIPGVKVEKPQGAFYLYLNIKDTMAMCGYDNVTTWVNDLLEEAHVAVVTGEAFGTSHHVRISYATDMDTLTQAISQINKFIDSKRI